MNTETTTTAPTGGIGDTVRDAFRNGGGPLADQARGFAKQRPWATAALAGVVGMALLGTLRGRAIGGR